LGLRRRCDLGDTVTLAIDLSGRRALVTGAGRGVGEAIARDLAAAGASVVVNDIDADRAAETAERLASQGRDVTAAAFDVTSLPAVQEAFAAIPRIDILVNNAGNAGMDGWPGLAPFVETSPDDWEPFLRVNLYGVMHCIHTALPSMIEVGWGRIVTVLSDSARTGDPMMAVYAAAKAGAAGLSRSVAREVGRHGITANCVALGTIRIGGKDAELHPAQEKIVRRYPVARPGLPDDVSHLVALLASDAGEWITGQTIPVNGGVSTSL
jgi:NAD(P)-dependent dehydrogenase (short-subunit alcohol dehydrogenase family)